MRVKNGIQELHRRIDKETPQPQVTDEPSLLMEAAQLSSSPETSLLDSDGQDQECTSTNTSQPISDEQVIGNSNILG